MLKWRLRQKKTGCLWLACILKAAVDFFPRRSDCKGIKINMWNKHFISFYKKKKKPEKCNFGQFQIQIGHNGKIDNSKDDTKEIGMVNVYLKDF